MNNKTSTLNDAELDAVTGGDKVITISTSPPKPPNTPGGPIIVTTPWLPVLR